VNGINKKEKTANNRMFSSWRYHCFSRCWCFDNLAVVDRRISYTFGCPFYGSGMWCACCTFWSVHFGFACYII